MVESGGSIRSEMQRLTDGTDEDRKDGDAELRARDEADGLVHQAKRRAAHRGCRAPRVSSSRARRAVIQGILGRDEQRTPQHEKEHDDDARGERSRPVRGAGTRRVVVAHVDQAPV